MTTDDITGSNTNAVITSTGTQQSTYLPTEACAECQGACCKALPGAWYPQDVPGGPTVENVVAFVLSAKACFDWWDGDPRPRFVPDELARGLFLRPRTVNKPNEAIDPSWGGHCVYLQSHGCDLDFDSRPMGCRLLEPRHGHQCITHGTKKDEVAVVWLEHGSLLEDAIAVVEDIEEQRYDREHAIAR